MSQASAPLDFASTELLTPERIATDPHQAFAVHPAWVTDLALVEPYGPRDITPAVCVVLGKTHRVNQTYTLCNLAALFEISRFNGVSVVTNGNGQGGVWARIAFAGGGKDLTSITRFLFGAGPDDQIVVGGPIKSDMRPDNLVTEPARKHGKDARTIALSRTAKVVTALEAKGKLPAHITSEAYLANLDRLLEFTDLERQGLDPLASLPLTGVAQ